TSELLPAHPALMSVIGVTRGLAAAEAEAAAPVAVCTAGLVAVEGQADTAARVKTTSATPGALDLRQRVNIYHARYPATRAARSVGRGQRPKDPCRPAPAANRAAPAVASSASGTCPCANSAASAAASPRPSASSTDARSL